MAPFLPNKFILGFLLLLISLNTQASTLDITGEFSHFNVTTKNWQELRQKQLVRQQWDITCGAAALSTLMTWYHDIPLDEKTVANALLQTTSVGRVRARGGFSLLDLKRFVEAIGFSGAGYGQMSIENLSDMNKPAILPIHLYGLDHFVVYRGQVGDRFYIGDPAFGNISMTKARFYEVWKSRIAFYVTSTHEKDFKQHNFHAASGDTSINDLTEIDWNRYFALMPVTRRSRVVLP
ncbi:MAG: C39 family peptidase [Gammaproteobacteria bacterium]|nr:C39 family peptidase [Gammaproteobacteria bacterium]